MAPEQRPIDDQPDVIIRQNGGEQTEAFDQSSAGLERHERTVIGRSGDEHHERVVRDRAAERQLRLYKAEQLIWLLLSVIEAVIGLRVFLKLIGANPANEFADFIYSFSALFLIPFFGLTGSPAAGRMVLEIPALIAMLVYALVAWGIVQILRMIFIGTASRSVTTYDRYRS